MKNTAHVKIVESNSQNIDTENVYYRVFNFFLIPIQVIGIVYIVYKFLKNKLYENDQYSMRLMDTSRIFPVILFSTFISFLPLIGIYPPDPPPLIIDVTNVLLLHFICPPIIIFSFYSLLYELLFILILSLFLILQYEFYHKPSLLVYESLKDFYNIEKYLYLWIFSLLISFIIFCYILVYYNPESLFFWWTTLYVLIAIILMLLCSSYFFTTLNGGQIIFFLSLPGFFFSISIIAISSFVALPICLLLLIIKLIKKNLKELLISFTLIIHVYSLKVLYHYMTLSIFSYSKSIIFFACIGILCSILLLNDFLVLIFSKMFKNMKKISDIR